MTITTGALRADHAHAEVGAAEAQQEPHQSDIRAPWTHPASGFVVRAIRHGRYHVTSPNGETRTRYTSCVLLDDAWSRAAAAYMSDFHIDALGVPHAQRTLVTDVTMAITHDHVFADGVCSCGDRMLPEHHPRHVASAIVWSLGAGL